MKYVCFTYHEIGKFGALSEDELNAHLDVCFDYHDDLRAKGHFAGAEALDFSQTVQTLSWKNGKVVATDGPYTETKEQLGGFLILDARDMNDAIQLLSSHPALAFGNTFEIRPIFDMSGVEKISAQRRTLKSEGSNGKA